MQNTLAIRIAVAAMTLPLLLDGSALAQGKGGGNGGGKGGGGGGDGGQPEIACIRQKIRWSGKVTATYSLVVMDADGSNETVILQEDSTIFTGIQLWDPSWSPDGQRLALEMFEWNGPSGIFTVNLDGTGLSLVATGGVEPAWSPDGSSIAYYDQVNGELAIVGSDGTGNTLVTGDVNVTERQPTWSPDGRYLAYIAYSGSMSEGTENYDVHVLDLITGDVLNVTSGGPVSDMLLYGVDWANHSDRLTLSGTLGFDGFSNGFDIWQVDLGSGITTNLSNTPQDDPSWAELTPSWSADDSRIAFVRGGDLYAMNEDGSEVTLLAPGIEKQSIAYLDPDWRH